MSRPIARRVEKWLGEALKRCGAGDRLPPDHEIARLLGVGERTVRSVMARLAARGVVVRIRGKGTFAPGGETALSAELHPRPRSSTANVAEHIAAAIRDGSMRTGDQLPQVKALCMNYHVNPSTVTGALRTLMDRKLICKVGRRFFVGQFTPAVGPARPGRVDFYSLGIDSVDRSLSRWGMRPAYAKMERELARHGFVVRFGTKEAFEQLLRSAGAKSPTDGILFGYADRTECAWLLAQVQVLRRRWRPRRIPFVVFSEPPATKTPAEVSVICRGNLATVWARTLARFLLEKGLRNAVLFHDQQTPSPRSLAANLKLLPEMRHLDGGARLRAVVRAPAFAQRTAAFLERTLELAPHNNTSRILSKYERIPFEAMLRSVAVVSEPAEAYESMLDADVWVFSRDTDAVAALAFLHQKGVAVPRDLSIIALENDSRYLHHGLTTCVEDWETIGYLMAHAIIGDFTVAKTTKGFVRPAAVVLQRSTTA